MISKLNAFLFILIYLMTGSVLILLPWVQLRLPFTDSSRVMEWGENGFLSYLSGLTGSSILENLVASGWFRGAVSGFGVFLIVIAFWEMFHFQQAAAELEDETRK
jgi:hypothetical protein